MRKDNSPAGGGLFEHLTVVVLVLGIVFGFWAFVKYRQRLPHAFLRWWLAGWSVACVIFAGEEMSWGQWYFGWETPETFEVLNDQKETNLHNMSSWLDQKPQLVVELFIFLAGLVAPVVSRCIHPKPLLKHRLYAVLGPWIVAPLALAVAALMYVIVQVVGWLPHPVSQILGNSELTEFIIAWFLMLYLVSFLVRLRRQSME